MGVAGVGEGGVSGANGSEAVGIERATSPPSIPAGVVLREKEKGGKKNKKKKKKRRR